jgi:hypothetical protein
MGIRVNAETLRKQLELSKQAEFLKFPFPYHQAIMKDEIPLSIGGGIGSSRTMMPGEGQLRQVLVELPQAADPAVVMFVALFKAGEMLVGKENLGGRA